MRQLLVFVIARFGSLAPPSQIPPKMAPIAKDDAKALMNEKDRIEAQIEHNISILRMNESTMKSPLLDREGFPRADIDIVAVRTVSSCTPKNHISDEF